MVLEELRRGAVRLHILHHASKGEVHGAWMAAELARHGHRISPGTLYPALHAMEDMGWLESRDEVVDGRHRRVYAATAAGRSVLSEARATLAELCRELLG